MNTKVAELLELENLTFDEKEVKTAIDQKGFKETTLTDDQAFQVIAHLKSEQSGLAKASKNSSSSTKSLLQSLIKNTKESKAEVEKLEASIAKKSEEWETKKAAQIATFVRSSPNRVAQKTAELLNKSNVEADFRDLEEQISALFD